MDRQTLIFVQIDASYAGEVGQDFLSKTVEHTLRSQAELGAVGLTVVISGEDQLRRLNREYLGVDTATDVLAFPDGEVDPDTGNRHLGDVLISYPRARIQAENAGHSVREELQLLVVHGVLHLLGYDHSEPESKRRMWAAQKTVLEELGSPITPE